MQPPQVQLPTNSALLIDQTLRAYQFTKHFDPRHSPLVEFYPEFMAKFDKDREKELDRLSHLAESFANGADVAIEIDWELVGVLRGWKRLAD